MEASLTRDIDGGWAYMVAAGNFIMFFLIAGFGRSFGIMYSAFLATFRRPDSTTSLLLGVRSAFAIIAGPLGTSLSERFTERNVVIAGSLITSLAFSLSFFANSLEFLIVTIGALQGFGTTLLLGPAVIAMGNYFDKKRSRAYTLTSCGGCIGMIVLPVLLQKMIEVYSVRGALLIYGALSLHLLLAGAVLRPIISPNRQQLNSIIVPQKFDSIQLEIEPLNNGCKSENGEDKINGITEPKIIICNHCNVDEGQSEDDLSHQLYTINGHEGKGRYPDGEKIKDSKDILKQEQYCQTETFLSSEDSLAQSCPKHLQEPENSWAQQNLTDGEFSFKRFFSSLIKSFQFSLLKEPLFLIIVISGTIQSAPYMCVTMYLVPLAQSRGISPDSSAIFLSVIGATDIVGRIICGALADRPPIKPQHVIIVTSICSGILCCLFSFVTGFYWFIALVIPYGFVCSVPTVLIMPATVNLIGLELLPKAAGILIFFFGIFTSITPPLLGFIKDSTGSYVVIFPLLGSLNLIGGLVLLLEGAIRRKQEKHTELYKH